MKIVKNKKTGRWTLDFEPIKNKRYRKTCDTRTECLEYYDNIMAEIEQKQIQGVDVKEEDNRKISELITIWWEGAGCELSDGVRLKGILDRMATVLGDIKGRSLTPAHFNYYKQVKRKQRYQGRIICDNTLNKHLGYVSTVFNYLYEIGEIYYPNPFKKVKKIRIDEKELSFLTLEQVDHLLKHIEERCTNPHVLLITKLCLATGARWSEIESRKLRHFQNNRVEFTKTKGKRTRNVPVPEELFNETVEHLKEHGGFTSSASAFGRAMRSSNITLPFGQRSHVLRHTFASHFMMNKGNILVLQRILGHTDLKMTMKYAKFDPDHFKEAAQLNPLTSLEKKKTEEQPEL